MQSSYALEKIASTLFTAVLSDILDSIGRPGQVVDTTLRPLQRDMRVVGYARTARAASVNREPSRPYGKLLDSIDAMTGDEVLVISMESSSVSAIFGGLLATAVQVAGGRGVVVDGNIRDANEIEQLEMPTFMKGLQPLDSYGRDEVIEVQGPVSVGGVLIHAGDLVFADYDGIVVIPQDVELQVLDAAFAKVAGESEVRVALRGGMSTAEAFERYGIL